MSERIFLMKRPLQWSHLTSGLPIPTVFHQLTYNILGKQLRAQQSADVRIMLDGEIFTTSIYNIGFNRAKFSHSDILQFKYDNNKALLAKLQEIFHKEYKYCIDARNAKHADDRTRTNIARAFDTSIVVYGTEESDLFVWEPLFENITLASEKEIRQMTEDEFETILNRTDPKAAIKQTTRLQKVRDLDTSIGDSLKRVYDYRCQMTGEIVGERYGVHTVEAHHILPFTESLNNDTSNIMILSPNYHRLIHKAKPTFNRKTLSFEFPNGLIETVKLNLHLK
jgi:predicted HNH restriction endonuclease